MENLVVAIGGNALIKDGQEGTIYQQFANARETCAHLVKLIYLGYDLVITHGNGPQVGNALLRHEHARDILPPYPLGVCVAETQGSIGYMLQQEMQNAMHKAGINKVAVSLVTQVVVDANDPEWKSPSKPVGMFYTKQKIDELVKQESWAVAEDSAGRGWRRVVPSPHPQKILEEESIMTLLGKGKVVIACGGGGLPVIIKEDNVIDGVEAVIDKDLASSRLATDLQTRKLLIVTTLPLVYVDFNKPQQMSLRSVSLDQIKEYHAQGQFPKGSMGPKIEAAIEFLERGGDEVIITSIEKIEEAMAGEAGTHIHRIL